MNGPLPLLASILALSGLARAQVELPRAFAESTWTIEQGLPQNSVTDVCQDAAGYFWVSTFGGLARFDGVNFDVFYVGNRPDLAGSRFLSVAADRNGELWTVVQRVGVLRYTNGHFEHVDVPGGDLTVFSDWRGEIWVRSTSGLGRMVDGRFEMVRAGSTRCALIAPDGTIWVASPEVGLLAVEDGVERVLGDVTATPGRPFVTMAIDREGRLWGGNWRGLWRATDASNTAFEREVEAGEGIRLLELGSEGELWIGSSTGLLRWSHGRFDRVRSSTDNSAMFADARGNLWSSGPGGGLRLLRPSVLSDATTRLGLNADDVWSVSAGSGEDLLVVQNRMLFDFSSTGCIQQSFDWNVHAALRDRNGALWVAGKGRVLRVENGVHTEFDDAGALGGDNHALFLTSNDELWVGSRGLMRFDGLKFIAVREGEIENVHCILEDADANGLWVGTQRGLVHVARDGSRLDWTTVADGLAPGAVRALHRDDRGVLWVATYGGGLSRIEGQQIKSYSREHGLPDDFLSSILEDETGRLWINSNRGPFVAERYALDQVASGTRSRVECITFSRGEGSREANGGNQPAASVDDLGRLWFPNIEGLGVASPDDLRLDEAPPEIILEGVALSDHRALHVEFAALGFSWPARVLAQYRLIGFEPQWVDSRGLRELDFSYLPPGDYELQLRARNGFGPWSSTVSHAFEVPSRYYETWIFRVFVVLAIGAAVSAIGFVRLRRVRAHADRLREVYRGRDEARQALSRSREELRRLSRLLLSQQEDQLRTVSAELHDDICQRIAALAIQMETLERRLDPALQSQAGGLTPLVQQAQQLAGDVQMLSRRLHPIGLGTLGMGEALRQECNALQRRTSLTTRFEDSVASDEVPEGLAVAAVRIAQEAMHNIEKHADASEVRVHTEVASGRFLLSIIDDGVGFDLGARGMQGLGLVTMRERAAAVGGSLEVTSRSGSGTAVVFTVVLERLNR